MNDNVVQWRFTGFYGHPNWRDRNLSWDGIRNLHNKGDHPWVVLGDFNEILLSSEKEGGNARPNTMMRDFRNCLGECGLEDMGCIRDPFTLRRGDIRERLDRAVCNVKWANKFPRSAVINEEHVHSDHRPLILDTKYFDGNIFNQPRSRMKQFEARWLKEETVEEIVHTAWGKGKIQGIGPSLAERTRAMNVDLHIWDRDILIGPKKRINKLKKELEKLRRGPINAESQARQKEILVTIENLLEQEEIYWLHRGRANWLLHGDQNTSFFHNVATTRKKRNQIKKLLDDNGV
uniref:Endonuclease/exonuclease/phosphatase domain-containing protein n=1 Tax=Triticum urartu TaxID=4572 RepID=A0A8R7RBD3_TRIUA